MSQAQELKLKRMPALAPLLAKAALAKGVPGGNRHFPHRRVVVDTFQVSRHQQRRYAKACGFDPQRDTLPPSFLHILAFRLQMVLMTASDFPVPAMGCVHLSNRIIQHRGITAGETLRMEAELQSHDDTDRGTEFTFICRAFINQELVWEDISCYLSRRKGSSGKKAGQRPTPIQYAQCDPVAISKFTARRYAVASGDFNPIHLSNPSAKLLGFRRMVVHGMWSKALCIAKLLDHDQADQVDCTAEFKTPVFLPARTLLCYQRDGDATSFELRDEASGKPHLSGRLTTALETTAG